VADVRVVFTGDADSAVRAARRTRSGILDVGSAGRRTGSVLKGLGTIAAVGVGAAFVGLAATLKVGFDELQEGQKVAAQTGAVLKSTGGIANVTAGEVGRLAGSLSRLTGIDDELIQTGENLLLTFKNVRNEVGAGNDVFNQATKAALDLSVAGFGSVETTAKQMGKALNDPVKGMTALGRAGVTFSEEQKKAIEQMVKSNDLLGAQKLILGEVESQVGGSAKAFGETLPGQLAKARIAFEEIAGRIAETLLPYLTRLLDWVNANMPTIQRVIQTTLDAVVAAIEFLVPVIGKLIDWFRRLAEAARRHWGEVRAAAEEVMLWYERNLEPTMTSVSRNISRAWDRMGADMQTSLRGHLTRLPPLLEAQLRNIGSTINFFLAVLRGDWSTAWAELKAIVSRTIGSIVETLRSLTGVVLQAAKAIGAAIVDGIRQGVAAAWDSLVGWIGDKVGGLIDSIKSGFGIFSPSKVMIDIGKLLAEGLGMGFGQGIVSVSKDMEGKTRALVDSMISAVEEKRGAFAQAFSTLTNEALAAFDELASQIETRTEKQLRLMDERSAKAERKRAIAEAKAALGEAQAGFADTVREEDESEEDFNRRIGEASSRIMAAQKALDEAVAAQQRFQLEQQATRERAALNERTELRRRHFEEDLARLQAYASSHALTAEQFNQRLLKIFAKYGVPFKEATVALGAALAEGLREAAVEVEKAAVAVRQAIMKHLSNIQVRVNVDVVVPDSSDGKSPKKRQHGGPVRAGFPYLVGEAGPEILIPSSAGRILPNSALRSSPPAGAAAGGFQLIVHVAGDFIGERSSVERLAALIKPELNRVAMYESRV